MGRIGRYELLRPLGRGGTGTVWEATLDRPGGLRKRVALKVLHDGTDQLRREARLGGLLRHRHLVDVYEVGEQDGTWFCALELCTGGTVATLGPLPPRAVVDVGLQVCEALHYAHAELGLVHLDLKPENLLLEGGDIKVADLGIARAEGFGGDGRVRGTPGYMAPEQARGDAVDARADVWALGVTLIELATGERPGADATLDLSDEAPWDTLDADMPFDEPAPGIPAWLEPAVARCLAQEPGDRWPDLAAVAEALRALPVEGEGLRAFVARHRPFAPRGDDEAETGDSAAFVGRDEEVAAVLAALARPGVVVVRGPVGIGKSRLAAEVARRSPRPVVACDTGEARDAGGLLFAVSSAFGVPLASGDLAARVEQVGRVLAARGDALLLLDGFDHLEDQAPIVDRWLELAAQARILVTTGARVAGWSSEVVLGPLSPADAVSLLVTRAAERGAAVEGDPALPELAARLDGVPLALELAAGRLGVLTVADVLGRLSLSLLRRGTDDRRGALRAALESAFELLEPVQRAALAQLSVFSGGFTVEAAEGVLDLGGAAALDVVAELVGRSMVSPAPHGRLKLLASVRAYAAERLGDDPALQERHGRWFAALGAPEWLGGLDQGAGHERRRALARDVDNLVDACRRAVARRDAAMAATLFSATLAAVELVGSPDLAIPLGLAALEVGPTDAARVAVHADLAFALRLAGRFHEALPHADAFEACARATGDTFEVALAQCRRGELYLELGRVAESRRARREGGERMLAMARPGSEGYALRVLGEVCLEEGRTEEGLALLGRALAVLRERGDARGTAGVLVQRGRYLRLAQRIDESLQTYEEALAIHRASGNRRGQGVVLSCLGNVRTDLGFLDEAGACYHEALAAHREVGDRSTEGVTSANLASLLHGLGRFDEALALLDVALAVAVETGALRPQATARVTRGRVFRDQGRHEEAVPHLLFAASTYGRLGLARLEGWAVEDLASSLSALGRHEEAASACEAWLASGRSASEPLLEANVRLALEGALAGVQSQG